MAGNSVMLRARGLHTYYNPLSEIPEGSLVEADNIVIDRNGIIEPRRGFAKFGTDNFTATPNAVAEQLFTYKNRVLIHDNNNKLHFDSDGAGSFLEFDGTFPSSSDYRMRGIEANGNFYFLSNDGMQKISATSAATFTASPGYIVQAGGAKALDVTGTLAGDISGFLLDVSKVAYRIVWGYKDVNQNLILGSPSNRLEIENTTGVSDNVELTFQIPSEIVNTSNAQGYFYQVYRTAVFTGTPIIPTPDEEYNLVIEEFPTAGQLTAEEVVLDDITPDSIREGRTLLYTNAVSGEGIENANEPPPLAKDITSYKNYTFLANTQTVQRLTITMLAGDAAFSGLEFRILDGTTTETFTFVATHASPFDVEYSTTGFPEIDIDVTARNLVNEINRESALVYAYYDSGANDTPGIIRIERQFISETPFWLQTSAGISQKFIPEMPATGATVISDNEVKPNRIFYSKYQQPEAFPLVNYIDIGAQDDPIFRIIGLRDSLFIFKSDGIYRLSGDVAPFQVAPFDTSASIVAPDSAVVLNNQIYAMSSQGIISITDTGVNIISRPIEGKIAAVYDNPNLAELCFGVSYETDRSFLLWMPDTVNDTSASQCLRFNTFTNTWVRWPITKKCGIVNDFNDKLYLGIPDGSFIEQERKSRTRTDHADRTLDFTVLTGTINPTLLTGKLNSVAGLLAGDALVQTQYLSIAEFNRLLHRLDDDPTIADTDYYSTLKMVDGNDQAAKLLLLTTKLDADTGVVLTTYTSLLVSGSGFAGVQTDYNSILAQLDTDTGVFFTDYVTKFTSTGTIEYESVIKSIDKNTNTVTFYLANPFVSGAITAHKAIPTRVTWAPQVLGNPTTFKQVSSGTVLVADNNFTTAKVSYSSDRDRSFDEVSFLRRGIGDFGQSVFGEHTWGGLSAAVPFRTLVPRAKQRCRYINCRFSHSVARESVILFGINLIFRDYSVRAYR